MTTNTTQELEAIEIAAAQYRASRDKLRDLTTALNTALETIKRSSLPTLRSTMEAVIKHEAELREAVHASPKELWKRKRTRTIHSIKIGWGKRRGVVEFDDEAKVIERIRHLLPEDQAELLIRRKESVHKPGLYDLLASDLKRLGITIGKDSDAVVVKDLNSELDRALEKLLDDAAKTADDVQ